MLASVFGEPALVALHGRMPCAAPAGGGRPRNWLRTGIRLSGRHDVVFFGGYPGLARTAGLSYDPASVRALEPRHADSFFRHQRIRCRSLRAVVGTRDGGRLFETSVPEALGRDTCEPCAAARRGGSGRHAAAALVFFSNDVAVVCRSRWPSAADDPGPQPRREPAPEGRDHRASRAAGKHIQPVGGLAVPDARRWGCAMGPARRSGAIRYRLSSRQCPAARRNASVRGGDDTSPRGEWSGGDARGDGRTGVARR